MLSPAGRPGPPGASARRQLPLIMSSVLRCVSCFQGLCHSIGASRHREIHLQVGCYHFAVQKSILQNAGGRLAEILRRPPESDGTYFLDREGHFFHYILEYLQFGTSHFRAPGDADARLQLRHEAVILGLTHLVELLESLPPLISPPEPNDPRKQVQLLGKPTAPDKGDVCYTDVRTDDEFMSTGASVAASESTAPVAGLYQDSSEFPSSFGGSSRSTPASTPRGGPDAPNPRLEALLADEASECSSSTFTYRPRPNTDTRLLRCCTRPALELLSPIPSSAGSASTTLNRNGVFFTKDPGNAADIEDAQQFAPAGVTLQYLVGTGSFGHVYRACWLGADIAVKVVQCEDDQQQSLEGMLSMRLGHPHLVSTFDCIAVRQGANLAQMWMLLAWCDLGTLRQYSLGLGPVPLLAAQSRAKFHMPPRLSGDALAEVLEICTEVSLAGEYLHDRGVLHGDLTESNILLRSAAAEGKGFTAAVCDFGHSRVLDAGVHHVQTRTIGSITHMSPERLELGVLSKKADVYSLGVVMWQAIAGGSPFESLKPQEVAILVTSGWRWPLPHGILPEAAELLGQLLAANPSERPCFEALVARLSQWGRGRGVRHG